MLHARTGATQRPLASGRLRVDGGTPAAGPPQPFSFRETWASTSFIGAEGLNSMAS